MPKAVLFEGEAEVAGGDALHRLGYAGTGLRLDGLLAVRWSSHGYSDVKQFCDRYGKPLVRLPAGYNPNQVAVQILSQCGEQLAASG